MIIANPIYDIVFKKLMEDHEIARGILERILETQIEQLSFASQEYTTSVEEGRLTFFRLDFTARIYTPDGWKQVMIELQKARLETDVERFRGYLGEEYRRVNEVRHSQGMVLRQGLPIITVYFFGYTIDPRLPGAFKITRHYADLITGEELPMRSEVMERLTHDSYAIQIPKLGTEKRNDVEELLAIFRQDHPADELGHSLIVEDEGHYSKLLRRILRSLTKLLEKPDVKRRMTLEDEMYSTLEREIEVKTRELQEAIAELDRQREEADRQREEADRQREEADRQREEADRQREEADRQRGEADRQREEAERQREEEQRKREEAEAEIARLKSLLQQGEKPA